MGLFSDMKTGVKVGQRNDDGDGHYWQKIDKVKVEKTLKGDEYLKIYKTIVKVIDSADGKAQVPGSQTTHAIFRDPRYDYFEKETRRLVKAAANLTVDEVNAMSNDQVAELLTTKAPQLEGLVLEAKCRKQVNSKNPTKSFQQVDYTRRVEPAEVKGAIPPALFSELFPARA